MAVAEGRAGSSLVTIRRFLAAGPPVALVVPAAVVAAAMALPLVYLLMRSLGASSEVWDLLFRARTAEILMRSVLLVAVVTASSVAIAVPLAWLTVRTDLPLRRLWAVLTSLPLVIPSYVGGFLVVAALGPKGMLQGLLEDLFGIERLPSIYGLPGAALTLALLSYPYVLLTVRVALWRLDPALEETSRTMGNGSWTTFRRVVLPLLRPAIGAGALLVALYTLSDFGAVSLLRYETFTWAIFLQYEGIVDRGLAASLSLILVAVAMGILLLEYLSRGHSRYYRTSSGTQKVNVLVPLGRWRWPAMAFCAAIVMLSLGLPLGVLIYWAARGLAGSEQAVFPWGAAWNSVYVSALAAVVAAVAAFPVALLAVRHPGWVTGTLERVSYIGFALPGIAVALALVFFASNYAWPVYQTLVLLVLAYVVLFLPAALGAVRSALLQVSPRIEEAARSLGHSPLLVMRHVTVPLVRSGLLAGGALVFLVVMKELPATLILGPLGFKTLATTTWSAASEAFFAQAALSSLMLIVFASIPLFLLMFAEGRAAPRAEGWQLGRPH